MLHLKWRTMPIVKNILILFGIIFIYSLIAFLTFSSICERDLYAPFGLLGVVTVALLIIINIV